MEEQWPRENDLTKKTCDTIVDNKRLGQVGEVIGKWDNGLYTAGSIQGVEAKFLVDSGSTSTLLSHAVFQKIPFESRPALVVASQEVQGVNGQHLQVYRQVLLNILFGGVPYAQTAIVCDIMPEGILGQDFMLKFASKIDYKNLSIQTNYGDIQCWIGGEVAMSCRVVAKCAITIPANSYMWLPVIIPGIEHLSDIGLVESNRELFEKEQLYIVQGVIDTRKEYKVLQVVNENDSDVSVYPNMKLGSCESIYIEETTEQRCATVLTKNEDDARGKVPGHLEELLEGSSKHLSNEEK
ncbi:hypothetical protein ACJMK2_016125, partial [Sinanodonta woodiana]